MKTYTIEITTATGGRQAIVRCADATTALATVRRAGDLSCRIIHRTK